MWNHKQVIENIEIYMATWLYKDLCVEMKHNQKPLSDKNLKVSQIIYDGGLAHHLFLLGTSVSSNL
jgi:hypothetical protein